MRHTDQPRYRTTRETRETIRVATFNLFNELARPPSLSQIVARVGRSKSVVSSALWDLEQDNIVVREQCGKLKRLVAMQGVPSVAERVVRQLESAGLLKVPADKALEVLGC